MPGETSTPIDALAILTLPALSAGLTAEQVRGAACVWCKRRLDAEMAVDFGARHGTLIGIATAWYPRGCPACVRAAALRAHVEHPQTCEQCVDDFSVCDTRRALRRLAFKGSV